MGERVRVVIGCLVAVLAATPVSPGQAQTAEPPPPPGARPAKPAVAAKSSAWRAIPELGVTFAFDDNVFLLAPGKKDNLDPVSADDLASGRYAEMEAAHDLIATLEAGVALRGRGLVGDRLTVTPEVRYDVYVSNSERSHARLGLTLEQALPKDGRLRFRERYSPEYFPKNYLADAVDLDGSETISADERRYRAGTYGENEARIDWRFRLAKATKLRPLGASLELGAGHYLRTYDEPFGGRDLSGPTAAATLELDLNPRTTLQVEYDLAVLSADPGLEVLLLDEPDFGVDFNGNGSVTDLEARVVETVDRSRTEHEIGASLRVETSPRTRLGVSYALRVRAYGSDEPYDIGYRDRRDTRHAFGASLRIALDRAADLTVGGEITSQTTNRGGDPGATGDEDDYDRHALFAALTYRP